MCTYNVLCFVRLTLYCDMYACSSASLDMCTYVISALYALHTHVRLLLRFSAVCIERTCCDTWTRYTYSRHMDALHIQQRHGRSTHTWTLYTYTHGRSTHTAPYSTVCMYIRIYIQCIHAYIHTVAICIHTICYTTTCIVLRRMHTRH